MTDSNCVLAKVPLQLIENILREFQLCHSQETIASHQKYSKTIPYCILANFQLHLIELNPNSITNCVLAKTPWHLIASILRQFYIVS